MRLSPFIYLKQKKAACLSMYQTYTQADSMKNHWTTLEILSQNETISFYIFKAKKAACLSMYQTYTQAYSMKNTELHCKFWLKMRLSPFIYLKQKTLPAWVCIKYILKQRAWKTLNFIGNFGSKWDYLLLYI